jgi:hypothetical protein
MAGDRNERLEAMRREVARLNDEWERVKARLATMGDVQLRLPQALAERIEASRAQGTVDINAVRG